jgi:hypothetical protein
MTVRLEPAWQIGSNIRGLKAHWPLDHPGMFPWLDRMSNYGRFDERYSPNDKAG